MDSLNHLKPKRIDARMQLLIAIYTEYQVDVPDMELVRKAFAKAGLDLVERFIETGVLPDGGEQIRLLEKRLLQDEWEEARSMIRRLASAHEEQRMGSFESIIG